MVNYSIWSLELHYVTIHDPSIYCVFPFYQEIKRVFVFLYQNLKWSAIPWELYKENLIKKHWKQKTQANL